VIALFAARHYPRIKAAAREWTGTGAAVEDIAAADAGARGELTIAEGAA